MASRHPLIASILGIKVLAGRGEEITAGNGLDPVRIGNMPPALITLCFEGLQSGAVQRTLGESQRLINLSDESLFGITACARLINGYQRIRAAETGLPLIRGTMTDFTRPVGSSGTQIFMAEP